jgi:hypothetical protein
MNSLLALNLNGLSLHIVQGLAKVEKVGPSGVAGAESSGGVEPRMVVESKQESLFFRA